MDRERGELISHIADNHNEEIRFRMDAGIAGHVASTGEVINTAQAYDHPKFNSEIDKKSGMLSHQHHPNILSFLLMQLKDTKHKRFCVCLCTLRTLLLLLPNLSTREMVPLVKMMRRYSLPLPSLPGCLSERLIFMKQYECY